MSIVDETVRQRLVEWRIQTDDHAPGRRSWIFLRVRRSSCWGHPRGCVTPDEPHPSLAEQLLTRCRELLALLDRHNSKEEPIIYPLAETDLTVAESGELAQFLRTGRTPDGRTCQGAAD